LAVGMPQGPSADILRKGAALDRILPLGSRILRAKAREKQATQKHNTRTRLQIDSHPVFLLEGGHTARPRRPSTGPGRAPARATAHHSHCGTAVEKRRWV